MIQLYFSKSSIFWLQILFQVFPLLDFTNTQAVHLNREGKSRKDMTSNARPDAPWVRDDSWGEDLMFFDFFGWFGWGFSWILMDARHGLKSRVMIRWLCRDESRASLHPEWMTNETNTVYNNIYILKYYFYMHHYTPLCIYLQLCVQCVHCLFLLAFNQNYNPWPATLLCRAMDGIAARHLTEGTPSNIWV